MFASPSSEEDLVLEHEFEEEIENATEYGVGMWTRWLTTYPTNLAKK